ncbi:MAG: hypothetical protein IKP28_01465 [Clostridia bacterium]|nr:hypothetical protein [Clostridia bacterium]
METGNQVLSGKEEAAVNNELPQEQIDKEAFLNELRTKKTEEPDASTKEGEVSNCLALTVKEEYRVVVFKNVLKKSFRVSWKIALSILTINFLNSFL